MRLYTACILLCLLIPWLLSCYTPRYAYSPAAHNVPVLQQKGDSKLALDYSFNFADNTVKENVSTKGKARGLDLQGAYAFSKHWAGMAGYFYRKERNAGDFDNNLLDSTVINYKRNLFEMAAGYYTPVNGNKLIIFQFFGGAGFGKFSFTDNGRDHNGFYRSRYHQAAVLKIFVQPAIMLQSHHTFTAALSSRFSIISYKNIKTDYSATELSDYTLDGLADAPRVFWEPALVNTAGFKKLPGIRLELQAGFAFLVSRRFVDYRSSNISAGLLFDLPKLLKGNSHSSKIK
ncbi:MAG: hypothetical protein U0V75_02485 [Ferruginibacter sp.]